MIRRLPAPLQVIVQALSDWWDDWVNMALISLVWLLCWVTMVLGPAIHAILACELGTPEVAYEHFMRAALVDLEDVRGNAAEGIHGASAGGVWQAVVFGFAGLRLTAEGYTLNPWLPAAWRRLAFSFRHHGLEVRVDFPGDALIESWI